MRKVYLDRLKRALAILKVVSPENFDQSTFQSECGTRSCIAGWYVRVTPGCGLTIISPGSISDFGHRYYGSALAKHFGISHESADVLFGSNDYTHQQAIRVLSKFIRAHSK